MTEEAPSKPLRPFERAKQTLYEAFPTVDKAVVDAVLQASGGHVERAFNALMGTVPNAL